MRITSHHIAGVYLSSLILSFMSLYSGLSTLTTFSAALMAGASLWLVWMMIGGERVGLSLDRATVVAILVSVPNVLFNLLLGMFLGSWVGSGFPVSLNLLPLALIPSALLLAYASYALVVTRPGTFFLVVVGMLAYSVLVVVAPLVLDIIGWDAVLHTPFLGVHLMEWFGRAQLIIIPALFLLGSHLSWRRFREARAS